MRAKLLVPPIAAAVLAGVFLFASDARASHPWPDTQFGYAVTYLRPVP